MVDHNNKSSDELKKWVDGFHSVYEYDSSFNTASNREEILGTKFPRMCRFCGKTSPQVSFKKKAHTVSEFLGNMYIKSFYECDACNSLFGIYENNLANFVGLRRIIYPFGSAGKLKRRYYISDSGRSTLYTSQRGFENRDPHNEIFEKIDGGKVQKCKILKDPFIPLLVYKSLVKFVLSVVTENSLNDFKVMLNVLQDTQMDNDPLVNKFAKVSCLSLNTVFFDHPVIVCYRKLFGLKECNMFYPHKTFILFFNQFCYQIFIPYDIKDENSSKKENFLFPLFPPFLIQPNDPTNGVIIPGYYHEYRDLSGTTKITNEKDEFFFITEAGPFKREYTEEEYMELVEKYNLRI